MRPTASGLAIAAIWLVAIWAAIGSAARTPAALPAFPGSMSSLAVATVLALPVLVFGASAFWMRHSPFYHPKLARMIDARMGENAFESFLVRLRPMLVFAFAAALQALAGLWRGYTAGAPSFALLTDAFFLSAGLAFAAAHVVLYLRKAVGVYPTWTLKRPLPAAPARQPLAEALRRYWWTLLGLGLFPALAFIGGEVMQVPFELFMLPFFAVGLLAAWPWLSGRAPYSFIFVAGGVWLLGGFAAAALGGLIRTITG